MKKLVAIILTCLLLVFAFCSCGNNAENKKSGKEGKTSEENSGIKAEYLFMIEDTSENIISIPIPLAEGIGDKQIALIENAVKNKIEMLCGEEFDTVLSKTDIENRDRSDPKYYSGYYIVADSEITYISEDMASVVFEVFFNSKDAAHPLNWLIAVNFKPKTLENVPFTDMYLIDEKLYNVFAQYAQQDFLEQCGGKWPKGWENFSDSLCSKEEFTAGMNTEADFAYYYTDKGVGISYPVSHSLGDYQKTVIPYSALTDNALKIEDADKNNEDTTVNRQLVSEYGYEDVITDYQNIVEYRLSDTFESDYNNGKRIELKNKVPENLDYNWHCMLVEMTYGDEYTSKESFGYILEDINGDSIPELFWVSNDGYIFAVFTQKDGETVLLDAFWPRYRCVVTNEGYLYTRGSGGAAATEYQIRKLGENSEFNTLIQFGTDGWDEANQTVIYYESIDTETVNVTERRYNELSLKYPFQPKSGWGDTPINHLY